MAGKPTHIAYAVHIIKKDGKPSASWWRVGVAFAHKSGGGFDAILDVVPVSGRSLLRVNDPKPPED
jgi:hypothetical protein